LEIRYLKGKNWAKMKKKLNQEIEAEKKYIVQGSNALRTMIK